MGTSPKYDRDFKKSFVSLHQNGKTQAVMQGIRSIAYRFSSEAGECPNHSHRDFNQKAPNLVWTSDFTHIRAGQKWYCPCVVIDAKI